MPIDLQQLLPSFIEESLENIEEMDEALLKLDLEAVDIEIINQIFRAVHTIKGNSAIFKFSQLGDLAKNLENLLDAARKQSLDLKQKHLDILLKSTDCLRNMLLAVKEKGETDNINTKELIDSLIALTNHTNTEVHKLDELNKLTKESSKSQEEAIKGWTIHYTPKIDTLINGNRPENLYLALEKLGKLEIHCDDSKCPELSRLNPTECYLSWKLNLYGNIETHAVQDILAWGVDESEVKLIPIKFETSGKPEENVIKQALVSVPAITSIRVATEKIDTLMNTVEDLVVTESVLKQIVKELESKTLRKFNDNLDELEKHSRRLQEIILRMRMVPVAFAISRFPKMVLEIAKNLGKEIDFKISGEQTEIDKTMVEKITDPLMHLIRNSIDHGIEMPLEREKKNKRQIGTIDLIIYQSGNHIIIDVKDDGAGLDAKKIRNSAINKGTRNCKVYIRFYFNCW